VLAIEAIMAAQAVDLRLQTDPTAQLGTGTRAAYDLIRAHVPYLDRDAPLYPYIAACERLVLSGQFAHMLSLG
jgi:histidine ammonia-lyase